MKLHTNDFKTQIKEFGKEIDSLITYELDGETIELGKEQLNSVTPHYEADILKSVMKQLDIDSNVEIPVGTEVNYQFGVLINNSYEYIDYGNYIVYSSEKQEDTLSWKIVCYDKMLYAMKDYEDLEITYPITIRDYLSAICTKLGITFASASDTFVNYDKEIENELYLLQDEDEEGNITYSSLDYTYRDVLDEIAGATASTICINEDDELEVRYVQNVGTYAEQEGTDISIENVDDSLDFSLSLKGDTSQSGTPTPTSPVAVDTVTGRQQITTQQGNQLFDKDNVNIINGFVNGNTGLLQTPNNSQKSIAIRVQPNTQYTISGVERSSSNYGYFDDDYLVVGTSTATRKGNIVNGEMTFTTSANTKWFVFLLRGGSETYGYNNVMLNEGNTALPYEEYKGKTYEINLGKNLLNIDGTRTSEGLTNTTTGTIISVSGTSSNTYSSLTQQITQNIPIGTYTFSIQETYNKRIGFIATFSDNTNTTYNITANQLSTTFTTTKEIKSYRLYMETVSGTTYNMTIKPQLEKGSVASSFSPYKIPIELCKIENNQDRIYKSEGKWYLEKKIGKVILESDKNWITWDSASTGTTQLFGTDSYNNLSNSINYGKLYSNYFESSNVSLWSTDEEKIAYSTAVNQRLRIRISKSVATTTGQFKTWLSNHNVSVYYVLDTPTTELIEDTELLGQLENINLLEGINNISSSSSISLKYLSERDYIDEEYLKDINVNFGEKYGPVNSIVFSRSAESDNIYRQDEESIEENGLTEIKIIDNQILNGNNRDEFIDEIFKKLKGFKYYINDFSSTGIGIYDLCDKYNVLIDNNKYECVMLNDEFLVTQGLEENIHTDKPDNSETDYTKADKTDRRINQTYIIVDKQNGIIQSEVSELSDKLYGEDGDIARLGSSITQTKEEIELKVSKEIDDKIKEGATYVKTTSVTIDNDGLNVSTSNSKIATVMTNDAFKIVPKGSNEPLAYFGYDNESNSTVARMDNLTITNYLTMGNHRVEKFERDGEDRTGFFYIGG